jgi:hypothetical protein
LSQIRQFTNPYHSFYGLSIGEKEGWKRGWDRWGSRQRVDGKGKGERIMKDLGGGCNERLPNSQTRCTRNGELQCSSLQYTPVTNRDNCESMNRE